MHSRRIVVTGMGAITPIGNNVPAYWEGLSTGVSGADFITRFDATKFKTRFACEVKGFDPTSFLDKKEARKLDLYQQFALAAAREAVDQAELFGESSKGVVDHDRVGVIFASGIGGLTTFVEEMMNFAAGDGTPRFNPFFIPKMIANLAAGHIAMKYGFRGPSFSPVSACASSNDAMVTAGNLIRLGKADMFIVGGAEAVVNEAGVGGFNAMKAMSERNDDPKTASRPFDKERDGFVLGEGAAALVLESLEHAQARGAKILCEYMGGAETDDAYHMTAPHPEGLGVIRVMREALSDAGLQPEDIDYINVHGTSTPLGDMTELSTILKVFGEHAYNLNISSTKSMTGHLLGAAGAIEAVAAVLSIQHQVVPPTINHFTDDPECDPRLNLTFNEAKPRRIRAVLSNGFGFGGHNASVIFKEWAE